MNDDDQLVIEKRNVNEFKLNGINIVHRILFFYPVEFFQSSLKTLIK